MLRILVDLIYITVFQHAAGIHDGHVVTDLRHDAEIVGDHDHGGLVFLLQILHQLQDLCLDRHVQSGGRFVRDEERGLARKGNGNNHPLLHAAGELVRIFSRTVPVDAHGLQHVARCLPGFLLGTAPVQQNHLADLVANRLDRIQGCHRVLENHGDLLAADGAHLTLAQPEEIPVLENHLSAQYLCRRIWQDPKDAQGGCGLACTRLAHEAKHFSLTHLKVQLVHRMDMAAAGAIFHREAFYLQKIIHSLCHLFTV